MLEIPGADFLAGAAQWQRNTNTREVKRMTTALWAPPQKATEANATFRATTLSRLKPVPSRPGARKSTTEKEDTQSKL